MDTGKDWDEFISFFLAITIKFPHKDFESFNFKKERVCIS